FIFDGWTTAQDGSGTVYKTGTANESFTITGDTTLYAQWTPITYTVAYEDNVSGETITVPTDSTDYNADDTVSIAVTEPTRSKFIFDGWTTAQDGSGTVYKTGTANESFTITGDTTLYAQWKPIFETDGSGKITGYNGTAKDVIIPSTIGAETISEIYELAFKSKGLTSVTIPEGITAIGYKAFEGNSLASVDIPNSVISIASRAFFENDLTSVAIGNQVQTIGGYAFYRNSLTNVDIPDSVTTIEQAAFEGNNLTSITLGNSVDKIEAWAFQYNNLTDVTIPASVTTVSQDVFQANLMETITFEGNSNEINWISRMSNTILGTISTQSNLKGFVGDIDNGGPWYEGTWYEDSARKIEATDHSFSRPGPQTYYSSNYTAPTYKVTFDVETNGADGVTTTNQTASVSEDTTDILSHVPADPTKTGYTFSGWFTAPSGGTKITDFGNVTAIVSNTIYYAQFAEPINTVTFDSNGGTSISQIKVTSGSVITMPADPTKSGYTFDGWYKSEIDDNGIGNAWDFTHDTVDSDITLYAKWTAQAPAAFTVSFDSNGGSVVSSITDVRSGSAITVPTPPERSGYTFDGWYKSEIDDNGSGKAWDFTHDTVDSDITLYAKWTAQAPAAFTVSFDSNGGSVVSSITDVRSGSAITAPTRPERNGYTFDGWYKDGALTDAWDFTTDAVTSDVMLYAKWAKKTSNSGSSGSGNSKKIVVADVEKEGNDKSIGVTGTMKSTSKKVEVQVDKASIKESIHKAEQDAVVKVKVPQETKEITTIFSVQNVKDMQKKDLTISVETKKAVYTIPTNNIDLNIVSEEFGNNVNADDIEFEVLQKESSTAMEEIIIKTAEKENVKVLMPSIDFEVKASYKGKSVTIGVFKKYVTRKIALSDGVDISKVTTATITKADGTIHHVPTYVELVDGKYYAVVNSLTNSTYTLIHNKQTYDDINMWAINSIENMAGRLIMEGDTETLFSPNRDITRAEFTKAVVKAIGLTPVDYIEYTDVDENSDIAGYIQTASEYGIIKGKGNGLFAPDDTITRQDAMTILYRISTIIEYRGNEQNVDLSEYNDFKDVSVYAKEAVIWNINSAIINGKSAEMLDPKSNITKAEVATVLERILKKAGLI
ncbi:MAG: InlB B-repeat-containing protein, partial [Clostridia bacterium]|nr:InlB B-repeat-containing protein [Clostridia bacterium]